MAASAQHTQEVRAAKRALPLHAEFIIDKQVGVYIYMYIKCIARLGFVFVYIYDAAAVRAC